MVQMMRFRAKYIAFLFVGAMTAYVLYHNEHFLIDRADPVWLHIKPFKWWLLPHGVAGACALLLAPLQFSERLRRRFTKVHRVVGRIYVGGVFVLAPLGVYIQYFEERLGESRSFTVLNPGRCGAAGDHDWRCVLLRAAAKNSAAPAMDDAQLRRGAGLFRGALHSRRDRLGDAGQRRRRDSDLDLPCTLAPSRRSRESVA